MEKFTEEKIETNDSEYKWYIIQTFNSRRASTVASQDDRKKAEKLLEIFKKMGKDVFLEEVFVAIETKRNPYTGEMQYRNMAPGYIFVKMSFDPEVKALLSKYQSRFGLIMGGYTNAKVIPNNEVENMKKIIEEKNKVKDEFLIGDMVKITHRDFMDFRGVITEILPDGYINVTISIFGRNTVIKCSVKDVEKMDEVL